MQENLSWLTDVLQANGTGYSVHRGLRLGPRRAFSFRVLCDAQERRIAATLLAGYSGKWLLPIWPDVQLVRTPVTMDMPFLPCETAGHDYVNGGRALLYRSAVDWQVVGVAHVEATGLQLAPGVLPMAGGVRIYPLREAQLRSASEERHLNDNVSSRSLSFELTEASSWPVLPAPAMYRGYPVVDVQPDESEDPTSVVDRLLASVDYGTANPFIHDLARVALRTQQSSWKLFGRAEHTWFRSLLYTLDGRRSPAWVPSWTADLQAAAGVAANSKLLRVEWCGYALYGFKSRNRRHVRIKLRNGAVLYREITAADVVGSTELLTLDQPLSPAVVAVGDFGLISFIALCTLASDDVEIQHASDAEGIATATTGWKEVVADGA